MPKRSSKPSKRDVNQIAAAIMAEVEKLTDAAMENAPVGRQILYQASKAIREKNAAAVALGRLGGLKGGKARAKSLSKSKRAEIAKKAAAARWGKK